ncbi:MAG: hypothetical protein ACKOCX_08885 [Planctomycetota bacterium]
MTGPILVVADNEAIARLAPRWAEQFAAAGRLHRVRLAGAPSDREIERLASEARSLAAVAIAAAGGDAARSLAQAVASRLGLPLVQPEAAAGGAG